MVFRDQALNIIRISGRKHQHYATRYQFSIITLKSFVTVVFKRLSWSTTNILGEAVVSTFYGEEIQNKGVNSTPKNTEAANQKAATALWEYLNEGEESEDTTNF